MASDNPYMKYVGQPAPAQGGTIVRDPLLPAKIVRGGLENEQTKAQTQATLAEIAAKREQIRLDREKFEAEQRKSGFIPDGKGGWAKDPNWRPPADVTGRPAPTAATYDAGIQKFNAAQYLKTTNNELQNLYAKGPGRTSGIAGLLDLLPTPSNAAFDSKANQLRSWVRQGTGGTGGENNTLGEMKLNVGAYIPSSTSFDETNKGRFSGINNISDTAQNSAIQMLGGVPDVNGVIHPIGTPEATQLLADLDAKRQQAGQGNQANSPISASMLVAGNNPGGPSGPGGGMAPGSGPSGPGLQNAQGSAYSTPQDIAFAKQLQAAYNGGASVKDMLAIAQQAGYPADQQNALEWQAAVDYRDGTGAYKGQKRGFSQVGVPESGRRGLVNQALGAAANTPIGTTALATANAGAFGATDEVAGMVNAALGNGDYNTNRDYYNFAKNAAFDQNPDWAFAGDMLGGLTGGTALESLGGKVIAKAAPKAIAALNAMRGGKIAKAALTGGTQGGLYGAGEMNDNRLAGGLTGLVAGGLGGAGGAGLVSGGTKLIGGTSNAAKRYLAERGVTLTPGQSMGGLMRWVEDRVGGKALTDAEGVNRAAFNEALSPIGATTQNIGNKGVEEALQAGQQGYRTALDPVSLQLNPADINTVRGGFNSAKTTLGGNAHDLTTGMDYTVASGIDPILAKAESGQPLDGNDVQNLLRISGRNQQQYGKLATEGKLGEPYPLAQPVSDAFGNANDVVRTALSEQFPESLTNLQKADKAWRNIKTIQDAVNRARNGGQTEARGVFGLGQLTDASAANAKKYGATHGTTKQPLYDFLDNAGQILPNYQPNSGTAMRSLVQNAGLAALGLGANEAENRDLIGGNTAGAIMALSALYSTPGRKALTKVFANSSNGRLSVEDYLNRKLLSGSGRLGAATGSLAAPALLQPVQ